jgi:hypothetical protein
LRGRVEATWLRGVEVWDGKRVADEPAGRTLPA